MSTTESMKNFRVISNQYLKELEPFSMEQLTRKPSEDEWSLGQMYLHLINTALYMQLRNAEMCMKQEEGSISIDEKTEAGKAMFDQGGFPPVRIQVPASPQYTPQQPESKEQIIQGLNTVVSRMEEIEPMLERASMQNTVSHPRLGGLNALEWFLLVEMHYRHHLLQLNRLKDIISDVHIL